MLVEAAIVGAWVEVGIGVLVGAFVGTAVGALVTVGVGLLVGVGALVEVGSVLVGVGLGFVGVGLLTPVGVGVGLLVGVMVALGGRVTVGVGDFVGVNVGDGVEDKDGQVPFALPVLDLPQEFVTVTSHLYVLPVVGVKETDLVVEVVEPSLSTELLEVSIILYS